MEITLVQADLHWESPKTNRDLIDSYLTELGATDIIVLPEMFTTGFSYRSEALSETMDGTTIQWMRERALRHNAVLTGSIMIESHGQYYNRLLWVTPEGGISQYDKRHLFRMAGEHEHFKAGEQRVIVSYKGWNIMLQVCYDLRFPVFARNTFKDGNYDYDLILYVANWPKPRHNAWEGLLRARAMENLSYCAGVNRVGTDGNGMEYLGGSTLLDFLGRDIVNANSAQGLFNAELNLTELRAFRERFPTGLDADPFTFLT